jgi:uncharacterized protein YggE
MRRAIRSRMFGAIVAISGCTIASQVALAQQQGISTAQPQIIVSGSAEIFLLATKASFSIGIMTSASSANAANEENARVSKSVNEALRVAHLKPEDIAGSRLVVSPRWDYEEKNRRPKRSVFEATNTIKIETENLALIGTYIDAALSSGATDVSDIEFAAKDTDSARRQALSQAVSSARADAEAIAHAGGGTLGELLSLSTERTNQPAGVSLQEIVVTGARRAREQVSTDVVPSQIKVTARIDARWKFVPAPLPK